MRRHSRNCALLCALALLTALSLSTPATGSSGDGPIAYAAHACHLTAYQQRHLGATYTYGLHVRGTRCRYGRKLIRAYNRCRHLSGGRDGHCHHRVYHYRCSEYRYNHLPGVSYDAIVRCRKPGRRVAWRYTQNL